MGQFKQKLLESLSEKRLFLMVIFSFFFVWGVNQYYFKDNTFGKGSSLNFLLLLSAVGLQYYVLEYQKIRIFFAYLSAAMYSFALLIGKMLFDTNSTDEFWTAAGFLSTVVSLIGFIAVIGAGVSLLFQFIINYENGGNPEGASWKIFTWKHTYWLIWAVIFVAWIPCLMAYFPGNFMYDSANQTFQAMKVIPYNRHHPPLHTFLWSRCIVLGNWAGIEPISLYAVLQMLFLSAVFARVVTFLIKKRVPNWIVLFAVFFTAFNPVMAIFSQEMAKDVVFGGFFVLVMMEMCRLFSDMEGFLHSRFDCVRLGVYILLCCLFRNNAIYIFILCLLCFAVVCRSKWKQLVPLLFVPILCFYFINGFVYDRLGVQPGESAEMLCVPMQQISNVVVQKSESLSEEDKAAVNCFIPYDMIQTTYNPRFADPIKGIFQTEYFDQNKGQFVKLWLRFLVMYPQEYIDSFLTLNLPYWYPDSATKDPYSGREYIETGVSQTEYYTFEQKGNLPVLNLYEKVAKYEAFVNLPIVSSLFSITTPLWALVTCVFVFLVKKRKLQLLVLLPPFFLWLTHMAGPVSNFRYIFPIFALYPLLLAMVFDTDAIFQKGEKDGQ